jgi:hypothetical protein
MPATSENLNPEQTPEQTPSEALRVELTPEQYNALLDRITELEAENATPRTRSTSREALTLDELAEEARRPARREAPPPTEKIDEMSNTQLAQFIFDTINEQAGDRLQKIETTVETIKVMREIDQAAAKHEDFWQYEDRIREISTENPTLSIERAYKLAKSESPAPAKPKEGERQPSKTERLLNLPPRVFGEKPGAASAATKPSMKSETLTSAAERAWNEAVGEGKDRL